MERGAEAGARLGRAALTATALALALSCGAALAGDEPDWAFPGAPSGAAAAPAGGWSREPSVGVPGSPVRHSEADLHDLFHAVDWRPEAHLPPPAAVREGRPPDAMACGFCHLPNGQGRPENASLAGLPAAYITGQLQAMRDGDRRGARPDWRPTVLMTRIAKAVTPEEAAQAADYFARQRFVSRVRVIEAAQAPHAEATGGVYRFTPGAPEPLSDRILEGPEDFARFETRDDRVGYVAYVAPGAVSRGRRVAEGNGGRIPACASCHGANLEGGLGPPLAGRSPTYLFRQLLAFKAGGRDGAAAAPMRAVASQLSEAQMTDVAAYVASVRP